MRRNVVMALFAALLISGCGKSPDTQPNPPPVGGQLTLALFGAPWCVNCRAELPDLDQRLKADARFAKINTVLYVTSGDTPAQKPSDEIAAKYKASLNLDFKTQPDPWRWKNYQAFIQSSDFKLPAAAILDQNGKVLRAFQPGTYGPADVIAELSGRLPATRSRYSLALFGAPWCVNCRAELPDLDQRLQTDPKTAGNVSTVLYVTSGDSPAQRPTDEIAAKYKASLGLHFTAQPDPWRWAKYRAIIQSPDFKLPAAAVLDESGKILRVFQPGTYGPADVMADLDGRL